MHSTTTPMSSNAIAPFAPRRIVIGANAHADLATALRHARPDLEIRSAKFTDITAADLSWGEAYLGFKRPLTQTMGNVRWVHSTGAGVDAWFTPHELPDTILLTRSSESFGPMIAEWALTRSLAMSQQLIDLYLCQEEKIWRQRDIAMLRGTTAVVVGTGDVGLHVGRLFSALGCRVHGVSLSGTGDPSVFEQMAPVSELSQVVADADWLLLMLPLTKDTRGLVSRDVLSACRGTVLINAGRGAVVQESAIPEALEQGWLAGVALDVFEVEPLPSESPLWSDRRVMISPHISGLTTTVGAVAGFIECLTALERGETPRWVVDRERQY